MVWLQIQFLTNVTRSHGSIPLKLKNVESTTWQAFFGLAISRCPHWNGWSFWHYIHIPKFYRFLTSSDNTWVSSSRRSLFEVQQICNKCCCHNFNAQTIRKNCLAWDNYQQPPSKRHGVDTSLFSFWKCLYVVGRGRHSAIVRPVEGLVGRSWSRCSDPSMKFLVHSTP